jgi:predicted Zn-dependent peptidase
MDVCRSLRRVSAHALRAGLTIAVGAALAVAQRHATSVEESVTDNGTRIWSFPDDGGERFVLMIWVGSGSRDETAEHAGIAHFLEHVLLTSTSRGSKKELDSAADEHGCSFNGLTTQECTAFDISTSAAEWPFAVEWLTQHLTEPAWLPADVEAERRIVCEELDLKNPHAGDVTFETLLYPHDALGRRVGGDKHTLGDVSLADLQRFYAEHYRAGNIAVGFAGRVPRNECIAALRAALASIPAGDVAPRTAPVHPHAGTTILPSDGDDSSSGRVTLGYHLPAAGARELAIQLVSCAHLEQRFFDEVREKRQLSYEPEVELHHFSDTHRLQFDAHVSKQSNLPAVVAVCDALAAELRQFDAAQLKRARDGLEGVFQANSVGGLEKAMELAWLVRLRGEPPGALLDAIARLDARAVADYAAQNLTPSNRFLISDSLALSPGVDPWIMIGIAVFVLLLIDGLRGFAFAHGLSSRWSDWRRRRAMRRTRERSKRAAARKIEPVDVAELERSIQSYFEEQDRKRGR